MKFNTKGEAIKAFKDGKLAKWELKPILEYIEFRENLSEINKLIRNETIFEQYYNGVKNPFTPNVTGYIEVKGNNNEIVIFEKSEGIGLFGSPLFGCSALLFNTQTKEIQKIELSKAFGTKKEAENYIKSISAADIVNAERYGEIKIFGSGDNV